MDGLFAGHLRFLIARQYGVPLELWSEKFSATCASSPPGLSIHQEPGRFPYAKEHPRTTKSFPAQIPTGLEFLAPNRGPGGGRVQPSEGLAESR